MGEIRAVLHYGGDCSISHPSAEVEDIMEVGSHAGYRGRKDRWGRLGVLREMDSSTLQPRDPCLQQYQ